MVAAHYKKDDLLHCWTSSRIFPATMRTFRKDTSLSEQGRDAAWHVWINARHGRGTAWARHAMCESAWSRHSEKAVNQTTAKSEFNSRLWHNLSSTGYQQLSPGLFWVGREAHNLPPTSYKIRFIKLYLHCPCALLVWCLINPLVLELDI